MGEGNSWTRWFGNIVGFVKRPFGSVDHLEGRSGKKYIESLRVRYLRMEDKVGVDKQNEKQLVRIKEILDKYDEEGTWKDEKIWADAYECDQLLIGLYDDVEVQVQLQSRIAQAKSRNLIIGDVIDLQVQALKADTTKDETKSKQFRLFLQELVDRQQWYDNQNYLKRQYANAAQKRVAITFFVSLFVFSIVLIDHVRTAGNRLASQETSKSESQLDGVAKDQPTSGEATKQDKDAVAPNSIEPSLPAENQTFLTEGRGIHG